MFLADREGIEPSKLSRWVKRPLLLTNDRTRSVNFGSAYGFRTRFSALKGRRPSPRSPMRHYLKTLINKLVNLSANNLFERIPGCFDSLPTSGNSFSVISNSEAVFSKKLHSYMKVLFSQIVLNAFR